MEVATMASHFFPSSRMLSSHTISKTTNPNRALTSSFRNSSLSTNFISPFVGDNFSGQKIRPDSLNPITHSSPSGSRGKRDVVTMCKREMVEGGTVLHFNSLRGEVKMAIKLKLVHCNLYLWKKKVIPFSRGTAWEQPPPDLASFLFKNRIVYLGMSLVPSVTELILAEFVYLQYEDDKKPIYLYINSTGTTKGDQKLAYDAEAFAVYDVQFLNKPTSIFHCRCIRSPIFTLCVGNAWGEAALILAAGSRGNRAALPSSSIMIKQPIARLQGQATDVNLWRRELANKKGEIVKLLAAHIGKTEEQIEEDIRRPKYFTPSEAVEYGIIDKVLYTETAKGDRGVIADLKRKQLF
ncbi:hypothetical protein LguiB_028639 [Lonicera macranthoides]